MFIADVSGHGTPAAVLMAITHAIAHAQPGTHTPPAELLRVPQRPAHALLHARRDVRHRVLRRARPARAHADLLPRRPQPAAARARVTACISLDGNGGAAAGDRRRAGLRPGDRSRSSRRPAAALHRRHHRGDGADGLDGTRANCSASSGSTSCCSTAASRVAQKVPRADPRSGSRFSNNAPPTDDQTLLAIRCR